MDIKNIQDNELEAIVDWMEELVYLNAKEKIMRNIFPVKSEIWTCNLGLNVGCVINKIRPVVIVQSIGNYDKNSNTIIVAPITRTEPTKSTHVKCALGTVLLEQLKTVSKAQLGKRITVVPFDKMREIENSLKICLGLE